MRPSIVVLFVAVVAGGWWFSRSPGGGPGGGDLVGGNGDFGISISQAELAALPPEQRKALEDAVRNATSPEDFERRMQGVAGQIETQNALKSSGVSQAQQYHLQDHNERYSMVNLQGWTVYVARELPAQDNARAMTALTAIDKQLEYVAKTLPSMRLASLRLVPVWLELKASGTEPARYNWAPGGRRTEGEGAHKDDAIEIPDVQIFLQNVGDQPGMMLHEFAHAYHLRALGPDNADVRRAYEAAKAAGLYANVKSVTGETGRAYALTNEKEYFAEITEAYFARNDFYPFTKEELRAYDPVGYGLVETAWVQR